MCVCLRCGEVSSFVLYFVPAVVVVSFICCDCRMGHPATTARGGERREITGSHPPWNLPLTATPRRRFPVFRRPPFPPARIATAHWAKPVIIHILIWFMQAQRTFAHRRNTTISLHHQSATSSPALFINLLRLICFLPLSFLLAPTATTSPTTSSHLWSSRQHHAYASRRIIGLSAHSTQPSQQIARRYRT